MHMMQAALEAKGYAILTAETAKKRLNRPAGTCRT